MNEQAKQVEELKKNGFRMTKVRKSLLDLFINIKSPISVPEITERLKAAKLEPDKATIYREIDFLVDQKIIITIDFCDGKKRYESSSMEHHHHLVCTGCNIVSDINVSKQFEIEIEELSKKHNFQIDEHLLEFFGKCSQCK